MVTLYTSYSVNFIVLYVPQVFLCIVLLYIRKLLTFFSHKHKLYILVGFFNQILQFTFPFSKTPIFWLHYVLCLCVYTQTGPCGALYGLLGVQLVELAQSWKYINHSFLELIKLLINVIVLLGEVDIITKLCDL